MAVDFLFRRYFRGPYAAAGMYTLRARVAFLKLMEREKKVVLFVPETAFRRSARYNTDIAPSTSQVTLESSSPASPLPNPDFPVDLVQAAAYREKDGLQEGYAPAQRDGWLKRTSLFNGRKTDDSLWKLVLRPIVLVVHPAVFWGMLTQGALIGWTVMIGVVLAFIVSFPDIFIADHSIPITPPLEI